MNLLAIDTSTHRASIALKVNGRYFEREECELRRHAEWVLPAIQQLLDEAQVVLSSLNGLVFGQGPGSFTGLRVACSVAKGLALGAGLPLYPVSGLASIAAQVKEQRVLAMIDARMQAWYWAGFENKHRVTEEQVTGPAQILWDSEDTFVLAGVGFQASLAGLQPGLLTRLQASYEVFPTARSMIELVEAGGSHPVSAATARPKYIRQQVTT